MNQKAGHTIDENRPKSGDFITVEPIREKRDIETIKKILFDKPRDYLLFVMGINNGLRTGDLLKLKVGDIRGMKPGDSIMIRESKTGKPNILSVNKSVYRALNRYFDEVKPDDEDYLFKSRKGKNNPLGISAVNHMVKRWCKAINLRGNFGAHSLRKTFGYCQRVYHGAPFDILCRRFNHSSPVVTMRYLGIQEQEIKDLLMNEI